jgi:hypothetical protein
MIRSFSVAIAIFLILCAATDQGRADEPQVTQEALRASVEKALPLLMKGAVGHREQRTCFSCHNQGVPILALAAAKERGFKIDEDELSKQLAFITEFLGKNRDNYKQGKGTGGQADTAGYALWTLAAAGWKSDETTSAITEYLLIRHNDRDHWGSTSNRPPTEASPVTTTYLALFGLIAYGTPEQKDRIAARKDQVRGWLLKTPPKDTEDRVFRLLSLKAVDAPQSEIEAAAKELIAKQREDGGWAQLDGGEPESATRSDAYATGTALVALYDTGSVTTSDPIYQHGLAYLLKTQKPDGSWHVLSRSKPFQTYFETGFPHGNDQFISAAATAWSAWALAAACQH